MRDWIERYKIVRIYMVRQNEMPFKKYDPISILGIPLNNLYDVNNHKRHYKQNTLLQADQNTDKAFA